MSEIFLNQKIAELSKRIESEPNYASTYRFRCLYYKRLGLYRQALADADKVVELAPDASIYQIRGSCYLSMKKYNLALADFLKAIEINPEITIYTNNEYIAMTLNAKPNVRIQTNDKYIARILKAKQLNAEQNDSAKRQYEKTLAEYSREIEIHPYDWCYKKRGDFYFANEKYSLALEDYLKAVELDPDIEIENSLDYFEPTLTRRRIIGYNKKIKNERKNEKCVSIRNYEKRGDCYFKLGNYKQAIFITRTRRLITSWENIRRRLKISERHSIFIPNSSPMTAKVTKCVQNVIRYWATNQERKPTS